MGPRVWARLSAHPASYSCGPSGQALLTTAPGALQMAAQDQLGQQPACSWKMYHHISSK